MKKILSILLVVILTFGLTACKKNDNPPISQTKTTKYLTSVGWTIGATIENFITKNPEDYNISNDFYVLAPQYEKKAVISFSSTYMTPTMLFQKFYVCNEEKYGKQITDYGQYGGFAYNFLILIGIDTTYIFDKLDLKFDYISVQRKGVNGSQYKLDVYNGEDCFASLEWFGYGFKDEQAEKDCIEGYLSENLMPHSQFAEWYSTEYEPSKLSVESGEKSEGTRAHYYHQKNEDTAGTYQSFISLLPTYFNEEISVFAPISEENVGIFPVTDYTICASNSYYESETAENPICEEPYIYQVLRTDDDELGGGDKATVRDAKLEIMIVIIPYKVDLEKGITFEWIDDYTANLWSGGICFATIDYAVDKIVERDTAFLKTYVENALRTSLHIVNP